MKSLTERNPTTVGLIGAAVTAAAVLGALEYNKLPFISSAQTYQAYFAEAGGLASGNEVNIAGYRVGQVSAVTLDGSKVLVTFTIDPNIRLGERTQAAIKTRTLLGAKSLDVTPQGDGHLSGPIPLEHTTAPYQLPEALGDVTATISGLNTDQLSASLLTVADVFRDTSPQLRAAADGVARFSATINARDSALRNLLTNADKVSTVLAQRSRQIAGLVTDTNSLLATLRTESDALEHISANLAALSHQISGLATDQRGHLKPALDKLNEVLTIVEHRKGELQKAIPMLSRYAMSLGETVGSGPYFKAYLANLIPGQWMQPFVDAAFSDLGLDPHVLAPTQLSEPPNGQRATPALPLPLPRTGQGGPPHLTLPDAITGTPGDPRYPYTEPPPAPPPGGPPPGPPPVDNTPSMPGIAPATSTDLRPPPTAHEGQP